MADIKKTIIKLGTLNVNGLTNKTKSLNVLNFLKKYKCDVLFLQETHLSDFKDWHGKVYSSQGTARSAGTAILFHPDFKHELVTVKPDLSGRLLSLKFRVDGKLLNIVSVYAPTNPTDRKRFYLDELKNHLALDCDNIVAGDFNCVESIALDTLCHSVTGNSEVGFEVKVKTGKAEIFRALKI